MATAPEDPPQFRRATADDALEIAAWTFEQGERIDMATLAERLNVGRTTLYRWVGDRDTLIDRVASRIGRRLWEQARREAQGSGLEHYLDAARRFMELSVHDEPVVAFATRESALALRIFLDPGSRVASRMRLALQMQLTEDVPGHQVPDEVFAVLGLSATTLVWANVASGHPPQIDATVSLFRVVLNAHLAGSPAGGSLPANGA
jgi:AcrR family transcriptional regulator